MIEIVNKIIAIDRDNLIVLKRSFSEEFRKIYRKTHSIKSFFSNGTGCDPVRLLKKCFIGCFPVFVVVVVVVAVFCMNA